MTKEQFEGKMEETKRKAKQKVEDIKSSARNVIGWCADHPGETIAGITALGACATGAAKLVGRVDRKLDDHREEKRRKLEKYDPVTGSWVMLKRPMTNQQQVELAERRQAGESTTVILSSMGLLKR